MEFSWFLLDQQVQGCQALSGETAKNMPAPSISRGKIIRSWTKKKKNVKAEGDFINYLTQNSCFTDEETEACSGKVSSTQ